MSNNNDADAEVVFEYTGKGCVVPRNVTIVRFHPSVTEVENKAFQHCKHLRKIVFHEGLQKIGEATFASCTSLSRIKFPSTVTEVGYAAFNHCSSLREVVLNEGLLKIASAAFYNCKSLESITLPSAVTEIGTWAFYGCSNLREVVLHGVPREIGNAFRNCTGAFYNCTSLERFTFLTVSSRLDTLIQTGHWGEIESEVNEIRGVVERSGSELLVSAQTMGEGGRNWNQIRECIDKITRLISYYELKEAASIFELALWKFKLDQVDKANPIPRKKCRMDVPGPVKDIIRQYLPHECLLPVSDIQSSSSESDDEESSDDGYL